MKNSARNQSTFVKNIGCTICALFIFPIVALSIPDNLRGAETQSPASQSSENVNSQSDEILYKYSMEDRSDPFVPFISETAATSNVDMNEVIDTDLNLTGMQLFEPGQLTLVALLDNGDESFAMVEDFTGKGYVITEGTLIGRYGVVEKIEGIRVHIKETRETRAGEKRFTPIVMVLKKEGEE